MKPLQKLFGFSILLTSVLLLFGTFASYGQCTGAFGDKVVNITFGAGVGPGPALESSSTGYLNDPGGCPNDKFYSIINKMSPSCQPFAWHRVEQDHTGNANGYMMLVNADNQEAGDFYVQTIRGLCAGTTYEFGAYIMNVLKGPGLEPNLTFSIETTGGLTLVTSNTGRIERELLSPKWVSHATQFTTTAGISEVVLRIKSNVYGFGNDLILDDITFKPCGPVITTSINGTSVQNLPLCEGVSSTHTLKAVVSAPNQEFQWQTSPDGVNWTHIQGANSLEYQAAFSNPVVGTYFRLLTANIGNINSLNCRSASEPLKFTVNAVPPTTITANSPLCQGEILNLGATGGSTYSWTGPNGFFFQSQNPTRGNIRINDAGTYEVTITTAEGCETKKEIDIVVNSKPNAAFTNSSPICENRAINFTNQSTISGSSTITEWNWNFGDNTTSTLKNPSHTYSQPGTYQVSLTVTSDKGCTSIPEPKQITVNPKAEISFIDPGACVSDVSAQFTGIVNGNTPVQSWEWDFGDGSNDLTEKFRQNPTHKYLSANDYVVVLKVKAATSDCETVFSKTIRISGATPNAGLLVLNENNLCSNQLVSFQNTSAMPNGAFGQVTKIELIFNYTNSSTDIIKPINFPGDNAIFTHAYPLSNVDKTYFVQLKAYSGTVCYMPTQPKLITVKGSPTINFNAVPDICQNGNSIDLKNFTVISNGYSQPGNWTFTGQGVTAAGMFNPSLATVGPNVITATFNPNSNCASESKTQTIVVKPSPAANAGPDFTMLEGGEKQLQAAENSAFTYKWTLANGAAATDLSRDDIPNPIATPKDDVVYKLTVTSNQGCINTDEVAVKVLKLPKVPNTFTPNGDNINDYWKILYLDSYPNATIEIYNRYGNKVFATTTYQDWDGRSNGSDLPIGTYYYIINPKNGRSILKGSVSIIR